MVITFGVKLKAAPTPTNIRDDIRAAWTAAGSMVGAQPPTMPAQFVRYNAVFGGVASSGQLAAAWAAGGGNPPLAPPNVSLVAKKATAMTGRKRRGRMYIPWCSETDVDNAGAVAAGTITGYNGGLSAFRVALGAAARTAVNGMYLLHHDGSTPDLVTSLVLRSQCGTQRPRLLV